MKEVLAVVRMNKIGITKKALGAAGFFSLTAHNALGRGKGLVDFKVLKGAEKGYEEAISQLGQSQRLVPKRVLSLVVVDEMVDDAVKRDHFCQQNREIWRWENLRSASV
jgi:nitrogen regulatory protein PII 2